MAMRNDLGTKLKKLMKARGIRNQVMAAACNVTAGAVSNWFSTGRVKKENLAMAAKLLGTTSDALITEDIDVLLSGRSVLEPRVVMRTMSHVPPPPIQPVQHLSQAYTLEALSIAASYDRLPNDHARQRVRALISNLEFQDDGIDPRKSGSRAAPAPQQERKRPVPTKSRRVTR